MASAQEAAKYAAARQKMVEGEIAREGVKSEAVLKSMRQVPRHMFVDAELRDSAYFDQALPIGYKQTISPPFIVAYMTETLDPQPTDRVLEIGTGSGYQAAVLSGIVQEVYTIEIVQPLGEAASRRLRDLGYSNVHCRVGDGFKGWPDKAPFDKIIVTCSPEDVPQPLVDQLKEGGRILIPLGERYKQVFYLFVKQQGQLQRTKLLPALFVPMTGQAEENREKRPDPANPQIFNGGFELPPDQNGLLPGYHYQRQVTVVTKAAPEGKAYISFENHEPGRGSQIIQGMAVDGSQVSSLRVTLQVRGVDVKNGPQQFAQAGFVIQFYDADRLPIDQESIGPWQGSFNWRKINKVLYVPPRAREAIMHVGLNGATGTLGLDDLNITPRKR